MNLINNEKGSALVFVLLLITVFLIMFLSLSSATINNAKQINRTVVDVQATSLAEMGVNFHKAKVLTKLVTVVGDPIVNQTINDQFQQYIVSLTLTKELYEDNKEYYNQLLKAELQKIVILNWTAEMHTLVNPNQKINVDVENSFEIQNHAATFTPTGLSVTFTSIGNNLVNNIALGTTLDIPITTTSSLFKIEFEEGDDGGQPNVPGIGTGIFQPNTFIGDPAILPLCPNSAITTNCKYIGDYKVVNGSVLNNKQIHITGSLDIPINMNNSNTGSTIWVTEALNIDQNFNSTNQVKIRAGGNATFGGNVNNMSNSIMVLLSTATFNGNIQNFGHSGMSILFVGDKTRITGSFDLMNNSVFYGGNDTTISGSLSVAAGSKVCVNGHLQTNTLSSSNNVYARSSNQPGVVTDPDALKTYCSIDTIRRDAISLIPKITMDPNFNVDMLFELSTEYHYIYN